MALKVGIQGVAASFHDVAARSFFRNQTLSLVECKSFKTLCEALSAGRAKFCLMAIENSIAGSILPNYSLLELFHFQICGEIYLKIELDLMALPGQKFSDLRYIQSHPMAILQCEKFLQENPQFEILEGTDTAESAKKIAELKLKDFAAIASPRAAEVYGLEVLKNGIESNKQNYTRFLVIAREEVQKAQVSALQPNKSSIRFEAAHSPGSLVKVLSIFNEYGLNMTKIQSVPILGKPYEYSFHVDLEWLDQVACQSAVNQVRSIAKNLIHFGDYCKGEGFSR